MFLSSVLHVPNFSNNLLFISSITKDLNCKVAFFPTHCNFQDSEIGRVIGSGSLREGLCWLDVSPAAPMEANHVDTYTTSLNVLQKCHRRLGHPPLSTLSLVIP